MTTTFLAPCPLDRVKALATKSRGFVAVPFIGKGAASLLPLKAGSVLVTRVDEQSVRQGVVHPGEVAKFIRRGVTVHACSNLHAKIYVFGRRAVVGSANVSASSARMLEGAVETTDVAVVKQAKEFVLGLCADAIGLEYARSLTSLYPEEKAGMNGRRGRAAAPSHSRMFVAPVISEDWSAAARAADEIARPVAERAIADSRGSRLDPFDWNGSDWKRLVTGDRLVQRRGKGRGYEFEPPSRVIHIEPYSGGAIVYLERQKRLRRVGSSRVHEAMATKASAFTYAGQNLRKVQSAAASIEFSKLWPVLAES